MKKIIEVLHWSAFAYYVYVFGYAGLFKVLQLPHMMSNMEKLGFDKNWTIMIGIAEVIGVLALLVGIWIPQVKNIAVLFLFPFAVGALTAHFAHHDYQYYYNALICCVLSVVLLLTDKRFKITV